MLRPPILNFFDLFNSINSKSDSFHRPDNHKILPERPKGANIYPVEDAWHQVKALDNIKPAFVNNSPKLDEESKRNLADLSILHVSESEKLLHDLREEYSKDLLILHVSESEKASRRFSDFMINPKEKDLLILVEIKRNFSLLPESDSTLPESDSTFRLLSPLKITKSENKPGLRLETQLAIKIKPNQAEIQLPLLANVLEIPPPPHIQPRVKNYVDYLIQSKLDVEPRYFQDLKDKFEKKPFHVLNADDLIPQSLLDPKRDKPKLNFIDEWLIKQGKTHEIDLDDSNKQPTVNVLKIQQVDRCHISVEKYLAEDAATESSSSRFSQGKMKSDFYLHIPIEYVYAGQRYEEDISYPIGSSEA